MQELDPTIEPLKISDVKNRLSRLVNEVYRKERRVLIEKSGIPVAALVSADDLKQLARLDEQRHERRRAVAAMREPFRDVRPEDIEEAVTAAAAEVRAERRARNKDTANTG